MVQNRHGAEHVSLSYKLMYWVLAAAAAGIAPTSGIRIGHLIGRDRHGVDAADQLGGLGFLVRGNKSILGRLRSLELQALVLSSQSSDLVLSQEIQNRPAVGVGVVDDVPSGILDGVLRSAGGGGEVVPHTLNRLPGVAAAGGQLSAKGIEARLGLIAQVTHRGIHTVESAGHGVPDGGLAVLEAVQGKALVNVRPGGKPLQAGIVDTAASAEAAVTAIAPTKNALDKEQNDPAGPIAAPAKAAVAAVTVSRLDGHSQSHIVRRKTHCVISFVVLFQIPAGNLIL